MNERYARHALAGVFFLYVLAIRTYDISTTFLMLGEQTRDWTIALGGIADLPLTGAPSTAGGRGFGPVYYWLLWLGRFTLGPYLDNLPHAGGITVALLQSVADTWLLVALSRRVPWPLALAMCLAIASGPFDIAISSLIWNPPVAAALIKMATATALTLTPTSPIWHVAAAAALAWAAVQCHLSALFVAAPLLVALPLQSLVAGASNVRRTIAARTGAIVVTLLFLQVPFFIAIVREPSAPAGPASAIAGLTNPQAFRPWRAFDSVSGITANLVWPAGDTFPYALPTLVGMVLVAIAYRRDLMVAAVSAGAILTAAALFTTSTRNYDGYWFVTLTTALTLTFGMALAAIPSRTAVASIGAALLLLVAWRQPLRIDDSKRFFKYPQYATMVHGSREIAMRAPAVKDIKVGFEVHPTMDRHFIYSILGGRIDARALYTAVIESDGTVRLE